ncbi:MAG TPA: proton-conducting transporter membrane subunit [Bacteroidia bacterium]
MNLTIQLFLALPLLGLLISFLIPKKNEISISRTAFMTVGLSLLTTLIHIVFWMMNDGIDINIKELVLYSGEGYEFVLDLYFDKIAAVYLLVGAFITFIITVYSRYYLHRESGYKRFFNTILFFYFGYNLTVLSGNFETLFIGWEILGISSFLLIAFYRDRYLPVRNAVKVFSIYRIGDLGILLTMWASHHLWHENITFAKLNNFELVHEHLSEHSLFGVFISIMILLAAAVKSAQLPFSSWLPRAMEGPTTSSAIFYGSLSVHLGVFLLLRTMPFWEQQTSIRILIGLVGLFTALVSTMIAKVQSSIKSQIAYASIGQIGLILIEVAMGFENLALLHFTGNAFIRTYQLLVSPSVVSYMIREQFYNFVPKSRKLENTFTKRLAYTIYLLSIKEFNLDAFINRLIFKPLKSLGLHLNVFTFKNLLYFFTPAYLLGFTLLMQEDRIPPALHSALPILMSSIGLAMVLKSFTEKSSPFLTWLLIILNHLWITLSVSFNEQFSLIHNALYLSGISVCGLLGFWVLHTFKKLEPKYFSLNQYNGHVYEYPQLAFVFLIASLGVVGFPISPTFIGEDLIFGHIKENQALLAIICSLSYIMSGISIIRLYARLFLGPHIKTNHETPYKSS